MVHIEETAQTPKYLFLNVLEKSRRKTAKPSITFVDLSFTPDALAHRWLRKDQLIP